MTKPHSKVSEPSDFSVDVLTSLTHAWLESTQIFLNGWESVRAAQLAAAKQLQHDLNEAARSVDESLGIAELVQFPNRISAAALPHLSQHGQRVFDLMMETCTELTSASQENVTELINALSHPFQSPFPIPFAEFTAMHAKNLARSTGHMRRIARSFGDAEEAARAIGSAQDDAYRQFNEVWDTLLTKAQTQARAQVVSM